MVIGCIYSVYQNSGILFVIWFIQQLISSICHTLLFISFTVDIALVRLQSDSMASPNERKNYKNVFDVSSYHGIIFHESRKKLIYHAPYSKIGSETNSYRRRNWSTLQRSSSKHFTWNVHECGYVGML